MAVVWIVYVTVLLVALLIYGTLAYWIRTRHGDVRGSRWFVAMLAVGTLWIALHLLMVLAEDRSIQWLAFLFEAKVGSLTLLLWGVFASRYSNANYHRHPLGVLGFGVLGAIVLLPSFVEPFESLLYTQRTYVSEPFAYVVATPGPLYVVGLTIVVGISAAALFSLASYLLSTPRATGAQLVLLVVGGLSIAVTALLGNLGVFPATNLNHTVYGTLPFALCTTFAFFRFRLFDVQPIARNAVVEQLRDPVFILDSRRNLADYNRASTEVVPDVADQVGQPFAAVQPVLGEALAEADDQGDTATQVSLTVGGRERHYSMNVSPVGESGDSRPDWYTVVLRDVTEIERSRWQLETQNERLDQVAGTISHDLRNPINVAQGFAEVLEERVNAADLDPDDEAEIAKYVEKIHGSHDRMLDIIEDILTIAREGKTVEETERTALAEVARAAWGNVETHEATLTVADDVAFEADRSKLLTVFENLFRNAVEHGREDGAVEVGATDVGFYVQDDGPGVLPESREQIFEYGYSTGTRNTGLGLSIVRTMAESHGWTVDLDEGYDAGARFVFDLGGELPVPSDRPAESPPPAR